MEAGFGCSTTCARKGRLRGNLRTFKDQWLPGGANAGIAALRGLSANRWNLKFEYARIAELLPRRDGAGAVVPPARRHLRGSWVFAAGTLACRGPADGDKQEGAGGITDRYNGRYECYGTTSLSAPLESIADVNSSAADLGEELKISFCSGHSCTFRWEQSKSAKRGSLKWLLGESSMQSAGQEN